MHVLCVAVYRRHRVSHHGPLAQIIQTIALVVQPPEERLLPALSTITDSLELSSHIDHDSFCRIRGSRRPQVGYVVENRVIGLVTNSADDGCSQRADMANEVFVGKRKKIFDGTAAARHDDNVDGGITIKNGERLFDFRDSAGALDWWIECPNVHRRPSLLRDRDHVAFCSGASAGNEPDALGENGEWFFPLRCE